MSLTLQEEEGRILELVDASPSGRLPLCSLPLQYKERFGSPLQYKAFGCTKLKAFVIDRLPLVIYHAGKGTHEFMSRNETSRAKAKKAKAKASGKGKRKAEGAGAAPAGKAGKAGKVGKGSHHRPAHAASLCTHSVELEDARGPETTMKALIARDTQVATEPERGGQGDATEAHGDGGAIARALAKRVASFFLPSGAGTGPRLAQRRRRTALYSDPERTAPRGVELGLLGHIASTTRMVGDIADGQLPPEYGHSEELFLNVSDPFCFVTVGVQGAGKSHTTNCVLEACLLAYPHVAQVRQPMAALVCHYDQSDANCCEATGLAQPNTTMADFLRTHVAESVAGGGGLNGSDERKEEWSDEDTSITRGTRTGSGEDDHSEGKDEGSKGASALSADMARLSTTPTLRRQAISVPPPLPPPCLDGDKLLVLCSPSNYLQRRRFYEGACECRPLLFRWSRLNAAQIKMLMRLDESSPQLYVAVMLDKLRGYQRRGKVPKFDDFVAEFKEACSGNQCSPVEQRFQLLSALVYESKENEDIREEGCDLADVMAAGRMVVADLTDPMMSPAEANGVFQVLLATFRCKQVDGAGKLVAFDEAHRYMGLNGESDALAREITDCARLMRHEGLRLLISTQSPKAIPEELLELTTVLVAHRFQSVDWHTYVSFELNLTARCYVYVLFSLA